MVDSFIFILKHTRNTPQIFTLRNVPRYLILDNAIKEKLCQN